MNESVSLVTITHQQYQSFISISRKHSELTNQHQQLNSQVIQLRQTKRNYQRLVEQNGVQNGRIALLSKSAMQLAKQMMVKEQLIGELKGELKILYSELNQQRSQKTEILQKINESTTIEKENAEAQKLYAEKELQLSKKILQYEQRLAWTMKQLEQSRRAQETQQKQISKQEQLQQDLMMIKIDLQRDNLSLKTKLEQLQKQLQKCNEKQQKEKKGETPKSIATVEEMTEQNQVLKCINSDLEQINEQLKKSNTQLTQANLELTNQVQELRNNQGLIITFQGEVNSLKRKLDKAIQEISILMTEKESLQTERQKMNYLIKVERQAKSTLKHYNSIEDILYDQLLQSQLKDQQVASFCCEFMIRTHLESKGRALKWIIKDEKQRRGIFWQDTKNFLALLGQRLSPGAFSDIM